MTIKATGPIKNFKLDKNAAPNVQILRKNQRETECEKTWLVKYLTRQKISKSLKTCPKPVKITKIQAKITKIHKISCRWLLKHSENDRRSISHRNTEIRHSNSRNLTEIWNSDAEIFKNDGWRTSRVTSDFVCSKHWWNTKISQKKSKMFLKLHAFKFCR